MSDWIEPYTVSVHIRPKPGAMTRLRELRAPMIAEFRAEYPGFLDAQLFAVEGTDEWRDVMMFTDREAAFQNSDSPAYREWATLVDMLGYEALEPVRLSSGQAPDQE